MLWIDSLSVRVVGSIHDRTWRSRTRLVTLPVAKATIYLKRGKALCTVGCVIMHVGDLAPAHYATDQNLSPAAIICAVLRGEAGPPKYLLV